MFQNLKKMLKKESVKWAAEDLDMPHFFKIVYVF